MKPKNLLKLTSFAIAACLFFSCSSEPQAANSLSAAEEQEGWQLLFDGKSLNNWHFYNNKDSNTAWIIRNGEIYCNPNSEASKIDLISNEEFENYELKFDWKLEKEGNSGVFINVLERSDIDATYNSGPEYQLLEDSHVDFHDPLKKAGCLYTFMPQKNFAQTKATGSWNHSKIVQKNGLLQFFLNNQMTAEIDLNSDSWKKMLSKSKFKDYPEFGKHQKGRIALQDWSRGVSFQNIKIKKI